MAFSWCIQGVPFILVGNAPMIMWSPLVLKTTTHLLRSATALDMNRYQPVRVWSSLKARPLNCPVPRLLTWLVFLFFYIFFYLMLSSDAFFVCFCFLVCQATTWEEEKSGDCCIPALCRFRSSGLSNGHPERGIWGGGHKLGWVLWQDQQRDPHTLLWRTEWQGWRTKGPFAIASICLFLSLDEYRWYAA